MTIFKEADLKTALPKVKKKVKSLVKRGYDKAKGTVTPKWIASQIAKKSPLGRVWKKVPKKQQQQVTNLLSKGYAAAKGVATGAAILTAGYVAAHTGKKAAKLKKKIVNKAKNKTQSQGKQYGGSVRKAKY